MTTPARDPAEAGRELAAILRGMAVDGHVGLDGYLEAVEAVAGAHGLDRDALHDWFAANDGRDMRVTTAGTPSPGP